MIIPMTTDELPCAGFNIMCGIVYGPRKFPSPELVSRPHRSLCGKMLRDFNANIICTEVVHDFQHYKYVHSWRFSVIVVVNTVAIKNGCWDISEELKPSSALDIV